MPVQGLFVLRHLPSMSLLLPAKGCSLSVVFWLSLGGTGRRSEGGMGENVFKMEILFSAQFTLSSVKNTKEVLF